MKTTILALTAILSGTLPVGVAPPTVSPPAVTPHAVAPPALAPVRVVATLPVYASIARAIGGSEVDATAIADPNEDSHFVRPKPSYALEVRRADLFVTTGLDLELWAPALLDKAGNPDVLEGRPGYVTAYTGVPLLDIPAAVDRSQGDVHIFGNPHVYTDPLRALQVARNITTGLKRVAPDRAAHFDSGLARYQAETYDRLFGAELVELLGGETLEQLAFGGGLFDFLESNEFEGAPLADRLGGWLHQGASLRGRDIICYHKNWAYFEDRFGVNCLEYVEAKPGITPTPRHVARLIELMQQQNLTVLLAASYFDQNRVEGVADRGHATAVILPMETDAGPGLDTYFDLIDRWVTELTEAMN
jgi:ABC-type Zn uptake system ZnuABC Zn-binding protein ZnuA